VRCGLEGWTGLDWNGWIGMEWSFFVFCVFVIYCFFDIGCEEGGGVREIMVLYEGEKGGGRRGRRGREGNEWVVWCGVKVRIDNEYNRSIIPSIIQSIYLSKRNKKRKRRRV